MTAWPMTWAASHRSTSSTSRHGRPRSSSAASGPTGSGCPASAASRSGGCSAPAAATTPVGVPTSRAVRCSPCGRTSPTSTRSSPTARSPDVGVAPRRAGTSGCARSVATAPGRGSIRWPGSTRGPRDGPVAIITRANVRRRSWHAFGAASEVVDAELHRAPGLIDVVGIGETPIGSLATFSLWESTRRRSRLRLLDAGPPRGRAPHPRRGLVRRGDVRQVPAVSLHRHLERSRPAGRVSATFSVVTIDAHR